MRKALGVSLAGWAFVVLMSLAVGNGIVGSSVVTGAPPMSAFWTGLCILASLPCLMVWMFGSMMFHIRLRRALLMQERVEMARGKEKADRIEGFPQTAFPMASSIRAERR